MDDVGAERAEPVGGIESGLTHRAIALVEERRHLVESAAGDDVRARKIQEPVLADTGPVGWECLQLNRREFFFR
jgi:hypothetical protein